MPPFAKGDLLIPGTLIRDVSGVRVGFIGLTSDMVARMAPVFAWGFDFMQGEENYRVLINDSVAALRACRCESPSTMGVPSGSSRSWMGREAIGGR